MTKKRDLIYSKPKDKVADFIFDEKVAGVFDDMIQRSVPGYADIEKMVGVLAEKYAQPNSNCYDLGCSLGAASLSMQKSINQPNCKIIAVDNSEAMVSHCRQNLKDSVSDTPVDVICSDVCNVEIKRASIVVINFTLQFIAKEKRLDLLKRIHQGLLPSGALILSEKIAFKDSEEGKTQNDLHDTFKKLNDYSDLEISQKRTALENVLIPEALTEHEKRLKTAGFNKVYVWFRCFNFASIIAFK